MKNTKNYEGTLHTTKVQWKLSESAKVNKRHFNDDALRCAETVAVDKSTGELVYMGDIVSVLFSASGETEVCHLRSQINPCREQVLRIIQDRTISLDPPIFIDIKTEETV